MHFKWCIMGLIELKSREGRIIVNSVHFTRFFLTVARGAGQDVLWFSHVCTLVVVY